MIKTMEELKQVTDAELLQMQKDSLGHTKDFQEYFGTEFSYTSLTTELGDRGYIQGWYKPCATVVVQLGAKNVRKSYTLCSETSRKWDEFCKGATQKNLYLSAALEFFMNAYDTESVDVKITM